MIVAGFGFRSAATEASLRDALQRAARGLSVAMLAVPADKCEASCLLSLSESLELPVQAISAGDLSAAETATQSSQVLARRGTGSVAEAAALAAAGEGAELISARQLSADRLAACAIAEGRGI